MDKLLDYAKTIYGENHKSYLDHLLIKSSILIEAENYDDAEKVIKSCDSSYLSSTKRDPLFHTKILNGYSKINLANDDFKEMESNIVKAINIMESSTISYPSLHIELLTNLAKCKLYQEKYIEGYNLLLKAKKIADKELPENNYFSAEINDHIDWLDIYSDQNTLAVPIWIKKLVFYDQYQDNSPYISLVLDIYNLGKSEIVLQNFNIEGTYLPLQKKIKFIPLYNNKLLLKPTYRAVMRISGILEIGTDEKGRNYLSSVLREGNIKDIFDKILVTVISEKFDKVFKSADLIENKPLFGNFEGSKSIIFWPNRVDPPAYGQQIKTADDDDDGDSELIDWTIYYNEEMNTFEKNFWYWSKTPNRNTKDPFLIKSGIADTVKK